MFEDEEEKVEVETSSNQLLMQLVDGAVREKVVRHVWTCKMFFCYKEKGADMFGPVIRRVLCYLKMTDDIAEAGEGTNECCEELEEIEGHDQPVEDCEWLQRPSELLQEDHVLGQGDQELLRGDRDLLQGDHDIMEGDRELLRGDQDLLLEDHDLLQEIGLGHGENVDKADGGKGGEESQQVHNTN